MQQVNLNDAAFLNNRRASYKFMRQNTPFATTELNGERTVVLTRYRHLDAILRDRRAVVQRSPGEFPAYIGTGAAAKFYRSSLPSVDAPDHTKLRRIVLPTFTPQSVARMEEWVTEIIERRLDEVERQPVIDIVQELGDTIPVDVACRLLHVPRDEAGLLVARVNDIISILAQADMTAEQVSVADSAARVYYDYFGKLMESQRGLREDDFVGALIKAEQEGEIDRDHACTLLIDVFLASYHTTMVSFGNAVNALALYPAQRNVLIADPSLASQAWDEVLRFDAPVHFRHRYVKEPVTIEDFCIEPGVKIMLALASANWDEEAFERPDVFDIARPAKRNMAFGGGGHFCLGSQLSRLEGKLFLPGFLRRFPNFRLVEGESARNNNLTFPHATRLTIEVSGRH